MTAADYLALIPSANSNAPKFVDTVGVTVAPFVALQALLSGLSRDFSVDEAVGVQLDAVGLWVGASRNVDVPLEDVFFTWDSAEETEGWDAGVWRGAGQSSTSLTVLPDDTFRSLIRAKIAANHWDGSLEGAYSAWRGAFGGEGYIIIEDHLDMSMTIGLGLTEPINAATQALVVGGYLPLKPAGVRVNYIIVPPPESGIFSWGPEIANLKGWGLGEWTII